MSTITAGCLFAGIGGFCAGFKGARIKTLWANENDPYAVQTFKANHPRTRMIEKSVKSLSVRDDNLEPVDILTAGFPCQSFSQAGDRLGFDDERGQSFFEILRILREFGDRRPPILLLENVPYLMYGGGGVWFEEVIRKVQSADYWFDTANCQVLNTAKITNLPHRRERLFMAAMSFASFDCNDFEFPQVNGKPLDLSKFINRKKKVAPEDYLPRDNRYYKIIAKEMNGEDSRRSIYQLRRSYARENLGECPPLTANMGGGGHNVPFVRDSWGRIRRLTVDECAKLQGFDDVRFPDTVPTHERYRQIGNAVSVPVVAKLGVECVRILRRMKRAVGK